MIFLACHESFSRADFSQFNLIFLGQSAYLNALFLPRLPEKYFGPSRPLETLTENNDSVAIFSKCLKFFSILVHYFQKKCTYIIGRENVFFNNFLVYLAKPWPDYVIQAGGDEMKINEINRKQ